MSKILDILRYFTDYNNDRKSTHINYHSVGFKARYYKENEEVYFVVSLYNVLHLLSIPEADRHETGNREFNSHDGMKNLGEMGRGRVWRRPVKIKELETKNRVVGTLREIDFTVNS